MEPGPSAQQLRKSGIVLYAVCAAELEEEANLEELEVIAGDEKRVYTKKTFPNLVKTLSDISNRCRR